MKKRLRKKYRTGEFTEYEFQVQFKTSAPAGEDAALATLDAFLDQIQSQGLEGGGSYSNEGDFSFFVASRREHGRVTEAQRQAVEAWLSANPSILSATVGPLLDFRREAGPEAGSLA